MLNVLSARSRLASSRTWDQIRSADGSTWMTEVFSTAPFHMWGTGSHVPGKVLRTSGPGSGADTSIGFRGGGSARPSFWRSFFHSPRCGDVADILRRPRRTDIAMKKTFQPHVR